MFQQIFKSKENKNEEKIEGFFQKGKSLIQGKLYKQAMIQFNHALELDDGNQVYEKLIQLLDEFSGSNPEAALAVGLNLLTERPKDFLLANKLGNFARELHDYKQAEGLYKQAIKVNRSYDLSIYNLAASKARVPYYDDSAKSAVEKFSDVSHFVLPDYITDSDEYISEIKEKATNIKKEKIEEKCEELQNELEKKKLEGIEEEVEKIQAEIEELNKNKENILPRDIYEYFEELAQQETSNASIHFYNQGIYALSHENPNPKKAIEAFKKVDTKDKQFAYLKLAFALAKSLLGNVDEAINLMIKSLGENRFNRYYNAN